MYNITPNKYLAAKARYSISEKIKKSITYLINESAHKLNINDDKIAMALATINKIDRLMPEIHYYHHALQMAMRAQNKLETRIGLMRLVDSLCCYTLSDELISILTIGNSIWEKFSVTEAIRLAKEDCNQIAVIEPLSTIELSINRNRLNEAIDLIAEYDSDMFEELIEQVSMIKLFRGKVTMGFTDLRILGAMFIRVPRPNLNPVLYFFEHVIHEASHIHLNCLMAIDPLILNSRDERFQSPLRNDPRPMIGVFHATYVSARIARSLIKVFQNTDDYELLHPLAETLDETLRGMVEIKKNAKLTGHGLELMASIHELLELARSMPEWQNYDFAKQRTHRFGAGVTKVANFQKAVA